MRRTSLFTRYAWIALAVTAAAGLGAQGSAPATADAEYLRKAWDTYQSMRAASPHRDVPWQYVGPTNISGRATDIAVADRAGGRRIYAAYATSGVWKTDDDGTTWQPIFDDKPSTSIGDIAVAPSNPDILWVGTGEANIFRASMPGVGIYKSTDAGRTFTHMGLTDTQTIGRILVHPTNPDIVYVAASGHEWTDNEMRGVFKTTDGGTTWTKVLYKSPRTGASDLVMDPSNPDVLYASMWQRIRRKWSDPRVEPGLQRGRHVQDDRRRQDVDGDRATGCPRRSTAAASASTCRASNPKVLYAFVDNYEPGRPPQENERDAYGRPISEARIKAAEVYRTDDTGATWRKVSETNEFMTRTRAPMAGSSARSACDPTDENTDLHDGARPERLARRRQDVPTFANSRTIHGDHHGLWIDPADSEGALQRERRRVLLDGRRRQDVDVRGERRAARSSTTSRSTAATPAWVYGSIQDIGSRRGRVDLSAGRDKIPAVEFENAPGGEGSHHAIDPANPNIVYSHGFYGNFTRTDLSVPPLQRGRRGGGGGEAPRRRRSPADPQRVTDIRPKDAELRAQWMAPIVVSPHDPKTVYLGYQYVLRSTDRGDTWERISPDLTANDPTQMLLKSSNAIPYQTITALAESPRVKGLIYAGTDDGRLHVTRDGGKTWTDADRRRCRPRKWYSRVVPSQHADGTVYVTQRGREDDDFGVYVYKSTDCGRTFTSLAANMPAGPVNVVREDPTRTRRCCISAPTSAPS